MNTVLRRTAAIMVVLSVATGCTNGPPPDSGCPWANPDDDCWSRVSHPSPEEQPEFMGQDEHLLRAVLSALLMAAGIALVISGVSDMRSGE